MPDYNDATDNDLLLLLKSNDEAAFTALYERYWKKLFVVASYRVGTLGEAEEIVQDIFMALWNRRHSLVLTSDLAKYLAVSVKYRVIKTLDKRSEEHTSELQSLMRISYAVFCLKKKKQHIVN